MVDGREPLPARYRWTTRRTDPGTVSGYDVVCLLRDFEGVRGREIDLGSRVPLTNFQFWFRVKLCMGCAQTRLDRPRHGDNAHLALFARISCTGRSSLVCAHLMHSITPIQNGGGGGVGVALHHDESGTVPTASPSFPMRNTTVKYLKMTRFYNTHLGLP